MRPAVQRIRVLQLCFNLDSDGVKPQVEPYPYGTMQDFNYMYFLKDTNGMFCGFFIHFRWT